jgi:hypothetical protein
MPTPEQQMTMERRGYTALTWAEQEDGAILILSANVVIDRWGDEVRPGRLVGGVR